MIHRWHAPHYQHVPLWLWPAVWWWLRRVDQWTELTGRQVFVEVGPDGTVYSPWWEGMFEPWDDETGESLRTIWRPSDMNTHLPGALSRVPSITSAHPGLDPGPLSTRPTCWHKIPDRAALVRDERSLYFGLPPPTLSSRKPQMRQSGTQLIPALR